MMVEKPTVEEAMDLVKAMEEDIQSKLPIEAIAK